METKLKVSFYLKRNDVKADGRCPVMCAITIGKSRTCFSPKIAVPMSLWLNSVGRVGGRTKEAFKINAELDEYIASAYRNYHKLSKRFDKITALQVKETVCGMACAVEMLLKVFAAHNH